MTKTAVVTGASSGIGAATARALAKEGFRVVIGARRLDRLEMLANEIGATAIELDVTDNDSVASFSDQIPSCEILINNAGGAFGLEPIAEANDENWRQMFETNVMGVMHMTRALLPKLRASGDGHIVNIGSIASLVVYEGGAGYTAAKHGLDAITGTLRKELLGEPIRVSEIDPGMVETDFSLVRFDGDKKAADEVYEGTTPLTADDIAESILWTVTRPSHVNVDRIVIAPRDQIAGYKVHRR